MILACATPFPSFRCNQLRLYGIQFSADTLYYVAIFRLWTPRFDFDHIECIYTGLSLIRSSLFSSRPGTLISRAPPVNIRYETTFVPVPSLSQRCFQFFHNFFFLYEFLYIYIYKTRNASPFFTIALPNRFEPRDHKFAKRVRHFCLPTLLFVLRLKFRILHFFFFFIRILEARVQSGLKSLFTLALIRIYTLFHFQRFYRIIFRNNTRRKGERYIYSKGKNLHSYIHV